MKGSITITRKLGSNTDSFLTISYHDSWLDQNNAIQTLKEAFEKIGLQVSVKTYTRQDNYNATYITIK